jgi:hypothetical protein
VPVAVIVIPAATAELGALSVRFGMWGDDSPGYSRNASPKFTPLRLATATALVLRPWSTWARMGGQVASPSVAVEPGLPPVCAVGTGRLRVRVPVAELVADGGRAGLLLRINDSS